MLLLLPRPTSLITSSANGQWACHLPHFPMARFSSKLRIPGNWRAHNIPWPIPLLVACHGIFQHSRANAMRPLGTRRCRRWAAWPISNANHARRSPNISMCANANAMLYVCRYSKLSIFDIFHEQIECCCWGHKKFCGQMSIHEGHGI